MKNFLVLFLSVIIAFGAISPSFVSASSNLSNSEKEQCENCGDPLTDEMIINNGDEVIGLDISDEEFEIMTEIAISNLEESTIIKEDGSIDLVLKNAKEAQVSKKSFKAYKNFIKTANKEIKDGEIVATLSPDTNLLTFVENTSIEPSTSETTITPMFTQIGINYYKLTNSDIAKVKKVINLGGGASSLASALKISIKVAAIVLAGATFLNAALDFCNWYDKGIYMRKTTNLPLPFGTWSCTPVR